jgi:hypothetical protein
MKPLSWKDVRGHLCRQTAPPPRAVDDFWSDFKARAALTRQDALEEAKPRIPLGRRWAYASAAAMALVVLGIYLLPATPVAMTRIKALEVVAPHSGVIIMNDQSGRGTILWISGMESPNGNG